MLTRREWMGSGALGALGAAEQQPPTGTTRDQIDRIVAALQSLALEATSANRGCHTGECGTTARIRDNITTFFRTQQKFPDFLDVGVFTYYDVYDWHVRNRQPLTVTRLTDGRYTLGYMFTRLVLRPDVVPDFIGLPYDLRA